MADEESNAQDQPQAEAADPPGDAPEAEAGGVEGPSASAADEVPGSPSGETPQEGEEESGSGDEPSADPAEAAALQAAQDAIASLGVDDSDPVPPPMLDQGSADPGSVAPPEVCSGPTVAQPEHLSVPTFGDDLGEQEQKGLDLLSDVDLNVKIELGRTRMLVEDVLRLSDGAVVELDKLAGDPVDVYVNDRLVARGEVLVLNENFCVRINEIVRTIAEDD